MTPNALQNALQALLAKTHGRPRWALDTDRKTALWCPSPGQIEQMAAPQGQTALATHLAAEAHYQTEALLLIAAAAVRLTELLTTDPPADTTNPLGDPNP